MQDSHHGVVSVWQVVTHLGSSSIMLPLLAIAVLGLWGARQRNAAIVWGAAIMLAIAATLATKIAFMGWGIGIASLNFTGISGHTLLASCILPFLFGAFPRHGSKRLQLAGFWFGLALAGAVGASRVVLGAHSVSEVAAAWSIGAAVSWIGVSTLAAPVEWPRFARFSPLLLLLAFNTTSSTYLPTHQWEVNIALRLSGNQRPFTRQHLLGPASEAGLDRLSCKVIIAASVY